MLILLNTSFSKETSTSVSNLFQVSSLPLALCQVFGESRNVRDECWLSKDTALKYSSGTKNISHRYGTFLIPAHNVASSKSCCCCRGWALLICGRIAQLSAGCPVVLDTQRVSHSHHSLSHHWSSLGTAMDCRCWAVAESGKLHWFHAGTFRGFHRVLFCLFLQSWSSTKAVRSSQYLAFHGPSVFCRICLKSSTPPGVSSASAQIPLTPSKTVWLTIPSCKICAGM